MLVAEVAGERHLAAERTVGERVAVDLRRRLDRREHRARYVEQREQLVVPVEGLEVHQHGAAGVGDVGDVLAAVGSAGQPPQQPAVGVAEQRVSRFGVSAYAVDVLEDPLDLAAGEVRCGRQSRLVADQIALAAGIERRGDLVGASVLPDDRVVVGLAGALVPYDGRLALVGDADGGEIVGGDAGLAHRSGDDLLRALPDLAGIVLDPAGLRHDLLVLELVLGDLVTVVVKDHEARAGRALVDRADILLALRHAESLASG